MSDGEIGPLRLKLVSIDEKKEFLAMYMSHRMELMSNGIEVEGTGKDDQLSRFWNDPDSNYLLWIKDGGKKIGFAAISVKDDTVGNFIDLGIFKEMRGKGYGRNAVEEIVKFGRYRGLKRLEVNLKKSPDWLRNILKGAGFKEEDHLLVTDL